MSWDDDFGARSERAASTASAPPRPVKPPLVLLGLAGACALVSLGLLAVDSEPMHYIGWALGSFVVISFLTAYSIIDARRAQNAAYIGVSGDRPARFALAVIAICLAAAHAYVVADRYHLS